MHRREKGARYGFRTIAEIADDVRLVKKRGSESEISLRASDTCGVMPKIHFISPPSETVVGLSLEVFPELRNGISGFIALGEDWGSLGGDDGLILPLKDDSIYERYKFYRKGLQRTRLDALGRGRWHRLELRLNGVDRFWYLRVNGGGLCRISIPDRVFRVVTIQGGVGEMRVRNIQHRLLRSTRFSS